MAEEHDALDARAANRAFYRAFADGDLAAMERVWSHGAHVRCVHPGWPMIEGWERVRASWARILAGPDGHLGIAVEAEQVCVAGGLAWVACVERLTAPGLETAMIATNVFERDAAGDWRMVQHHASPILTHGEEPAGGDVN